MHSSWHQLRDIAVVLNRVFVSSKYSAKEAAFLIRSGYSGGFLWRQLFEDLSSKGRMHRPWHQLSRVTVGTGRQGGKVGWAAHVAGLDGGGGGFTLSTDQRGWP
ncbi:hypothetical protein PspLS_11832 [Pyricularia sp. CBS 133598]|nr:hypothetical protein PspLS_11832 [Pyricularia sp. CBS 133598]